MSRSVAPATRSRSNLRRAGARRAHRWVAFAVACCALAACDGLLGIEKLQVDGPTEDPDVTPPDPAPKLKDATPDVRVQPDRDAETDAGPKRVFLTSAVTKGNIGGVEKAHQRCRDAAKEANLGGEWVAWISGEGKKAGDNLTSDGPYVLLDGTQVAANKAALLVVTGKTPLTAAITMFENEQRLNDTLGAWTGTNANGEIDETCANWSTSSVAAVGTAADPKLTNESWTDMGGRYAGPATGWECSWDGRLYCFEL